MIVTLPLPSRIVQYFPKEMVDALQWFAFWSFAGLLTIPWLFCVLSISVSILEHHANDSTVRYQLVTHNIGRKRKIKTVLDEHSAPKVVVIMVRWIHAKFHLLSTDSIV